MANIKEKLNNISDVLQRSADLLRDIEWGYRDEDDGLNIEKKCPCCGQEEDYGHASMCELSWLMNDLDDAVSTLED